MKNFWTILYLSLFSFLFTYCTPPSSESDGNPPSPSFNLTGSDEKAIALADQVMDASGGRKNWDNARFFSWVFAGKRTHYWDKWKGNIRIESAADSTIYLMNINTMQGKIQKAGKIVDDPEQLAELLKNGKSMWINDAYWLVMPFKMKDDGVTLKYIVQDSTVAGRPAEVISMTFEKVGDTPDNKYLVYIDQESKLVTEWAFYKDANQDTANFIMPWNNYQKYGNLLLSSDRDRLQLTEISVSENMPDSIFTDF
ncbi:MAG: hypothetical protein R2788_09920 [Saprospiraceae bacterium]